MKNKLIIAFLLIAASFPGFSQEPAGFGLFTDREVYVSGENLLAKIYTPAENLSRILHFDLVNRYGTRITGVSVEIKNNEADGFLLLPDSLSTGTYLLRAYLKNSASGLKVIREIWVSNRFDEMNDLKSVNRLTGLDIIPDIKSGQIDIEGIAPRYKTKNQLSGAIKIDDKLLNEIDGNLLISVAQTDSAFSPESYLWRSSQGKEDLTEKKGIILTGSVTDKTTSLPASGITVSLTIPDSIPGFQYYQTQEDGRFYFMLDKYSGQAEAFIQCFGNTASQHLKIRLDELFAGPGKLPAFRQEQITESFRSNALRNIEVVTFQKIFDQHYLKFLTPPNQRNNSYPYYGQPSQTVDPHLFYDLPDFNEISKELLPGVKFRNFSNKSTMQVIDADLHEYFNENPLILIDGIPVRDPNVIKNMGTPEIKRIDICQSERFFGDLRFPGVVAIYTTKGDYSEIPESDQLIRLKLEMIQVPVSLDATVKSVETIPDLRQVIYWNPVVKPDKMISVQCHTSSVIGNFKLIVRGKLKDGTLIFSEKQFEVK